MIIIFTINFYNFRKSIVLANRHLLTINHLLIVYVFNECFRIDLINSPQILVSTDIYLKIKSYGRKPEEVHLLY